MPWNAFITAADYYAKEFPGKHVDRLITVCYLPVNLLVLAILMFCDSRHENRWTRTRIFFGFCIYSISMFLVPLLDKLGALSLFPLLFLVSLTGACDVRVRKLAVLATRTS